MPRSTTIFIEEFLAHRRQVSNHSHADIILRSRNFHEFRVPTVYVIDSSPVLAELIRTRSCPSVSDTAVPTGELEAVTSLPVVQLSDCSGILSSLLGFIIPVPSNLPPTVEDIMELLSTGPKVRNGRRSNAHQK